MAAPTTTTGKGAFAISAAIATATPAARWSISNLVLVLRVFTATSAVNKTIGISALIRWIRGLLSQLSGIADPAYLIP